MLEYDQGGLIIAASVPIQDRPNLLSRLQGERENAYKKEVAEIESTRFLPYASHLFQFNDSRRRQLRAIIAKVGSKLQECGVDNVERHLPAEDRFIIVEPNILCKGKNWTARGRYSPVGNYIRIGLSPIRGLEDPKTQFSIVHEISHFTAMKVYQLDKDKKRLDCQRVGFATAKGVTSSRGVVWEEPTANLFGLFCIDSDMEFKIPHCHETVFLLAMIGKISQLQNVPPLEVFKHLVRAKTVRDFSIQRELADVLGNNVVRLMNHTRYIAWTGDTKAYKKAAQSGGFFEVYDRLDRSTTNGQTVRVSDFIPDIKGMIRSM